MIQFSEAQLLAWLTPILWPFLRVLAVFSSAPVLSMRNVPIRVRVGLSLFIAYAAQPSLPAQAVVPLDSNAIWGLVAQQVLIGLTLGFAARVVFSAIEFAGELLGLAMGLNFASFFDPTSGSGGTAISSFFGTTASWLFVVINGHLLIAAAVMQSFTAFPVSDQPLAFLSVLQPQQWGSEIFRLGLWIALPIVSMLLLVNFMMGLISRVAPQINVFAVGFPLTLSVGLVGLWASLPMMQDPFTAALERMLGYFQ